MDGTRMGKQHQYELVDVVVADSTAVEISAVDDRLHWLSGDSKRRYPTMRDGDPHHLLQRHPMALFQWKNGNRHWKTNILSCESPSASSNSTCLFTQLGGSCCAQTRKRFARQTARRRSTHRWRWRRVSKWFRSCCHQHR